MATWTEKDSVLIGTYSELKIPEKVHVWIFDLDQTVIKPTNGRRFSKGDADWEYFSKNTKSTLLKNVIEDRIILLITNQAGLKTDKKKQIFRSKVDKVLKDIGTPTILYAATRYDMYRKPSTGIMQHLILPMLKDAGVTRIKSIVYVGDAAGRVGDHNDTDRKFLSNIQIKMRTLRGKKPAFSGKTSFYTPEQVFLGKKVQPFTLKGIGPQQLLSDAQTINGKKIKLTDLDTSIDYLKSDTNHQEVILTVGAAASGKSSIADQVTDWANYESVSQDEYRTWQKTIKMMLEALNRGKSVIVENTHPDVISRKRYIEAAQDYFESKDKPVQIRAFFINGDWDKQKRRDFAEHMNVVRSRLGGKYIQQVAYRTYFKKFKKPDESEGFTEIINTKFMPRLDSPEHAIAFLQRT
jgi:bifunctional polynucleotide phosphatase/kinase